MIGERHVQLWGCGDLDTVFGGDVTTVPWPRAPKGALHRDGLDSLVRRLRGIAPRLTDIDPRTLWANQPSVLRHHAAYYLTGHWERTGTTSADMAAALNRYPVIVTDRRGRRIIATGHHRSLAALIQGRPLRCRRVDSTPTEPQPSPDAALTITPLLRIAEGGADDVDVVAVALGRAGPRAEPITVESEATAADVLKCLGLDEAQVQDRLTMATSGRTTVDR